MATIRGCNKRLVAGGYAERYERKRDESDAFSKVRDTKTALHISIYLHTTLESQITATVSSSPTDKTMISPNIIDYKQD